MGQRLMTVDPQRSVAGVISSFSFRPPSALIREHVPLSKVARTLGHRTLSGYGHPRRCLCDTPKHNDRYCLWVLENQVRDRWGAAPGLRGCTDEPFPIHPESCLMPTQQPFGVTK